jgi:uncharacterized membrane protein HdeD (DUF308 family)
MAAEPAPDSLDPDSLETLREIGRSWGLVLALGLITLALGIVVTFRPGGTARALAIIFGIWLLVLGVIWIVRAIAERREATGLRFGLALCGLLAVLIGLLVLHHSFETVAVLGFIIGVFWVVEGLALLIVGFSPEAEGQRAGTLLTGLVFAVTGIVCLIYPGLSLTILAVILGIGLIVAGLVQITFAFRIRRLRRI